MQRGDASGCRPIPVNVIFSPAWWNRRCGISFEEPFYLDPETRIRNDVLMRRRLYEVFGLGAPDPQPRPVIGSRHIAGGYVIPALLGVAIRFSSDQAAWAIPRELDRASALALRVPEIENTWPMSVLIEQMNALEARFGYVTGDLNTGGIFNNAVELRGNDLFLDLAEDPELADHLFSVVAETQVRVSRYLRARTGTSSIAVNRSILDVDPGIHLAANCSVSMMSARMYQNRVLRHEMHAARELAPYGIHHCGGNLHKYAEPYNRLDPRFLDVGSGSDVAACSRLYPKAFLNLRMNPVHLLQYTEDQVYREAQNLLGACGRTANVGLCCINMDGLTPDANVKAMFRAVRDYEGAGD
ncbi:MAG: uroporphyrinogen decarboxylase family protein [Acidobacteria bacterium]|nr:uroporphyrinogen decarboxylase family protein [Acidobacteriota bacterium]